MRIVVRQAGKTTAPCTVQAARVFSRLGRAENLFLIAGYFADASTDQRNKYPYGSDAATGSQATRFASQGNDEIHLAQLILNDEVMLKCFHPRDLDVLREILSQVREAVERSDYKHAHSRAQAASNMADQLR